MIAEPYQIIHVLYKGMKTKHGIYFWYECESHTSQICTCGKNQKEKKKERTNYDNKNIYIKKKTLKL